VRIEEAEICPICLACGTDERQRETELTKLIEQYALRDRRDGETEAKCFARHFTANNEQGGLFRRCDSHKACGPTPFAGDDGDDGERAYKKLTKLVVDERARNPRLTEAQAFSKALRDNPELATKAERM
jgi:hypothetical protein